MSGKGFAQKKRVDLGTNLILAKLTKGGKEWQLIARPEDAWTAKQLIADENRKLKEAAEKSSPAKESKSPPKETEETPKAKPAIKQFTVKDVLAHSQINLLGIFEGDIVFHDVQKAEKASEEEIKAAFETTRIDEIQAYFLLNAHFNWTKEQRDHVMLVKKKKIVEILVKNSINPQTKKPHPPARIEKVMEDAKVAIDPNKLPEEQVEDVIKKISGILPIKMEKAEFAVMIPVQYAAKAYNIVDRMASITKSEWQSDGSWLGTVVLPAGVQAEFMEKVNKLCMGRAAIEKVK